MKKSIFITAIALSSIFALTSCNMEKIIPSGNVVTKTNNINYFNEINVSHGILVELTTTDVDNDKVTVEADDNIIDMIDVYTFEGDLIIRLNRNNVSFLPTPTMKVYVNASLLEEISGSGGSRISCTNKLVSSELSLELSGGSRFWGEVETDEFDVELSGGSQATISGSCTEFDLEASGGSRITGYDFTSSQADIELSGGSYAAQTITGTLRVNASGGSKLEYKGNPNIISKVVTGGSAVNNVN